MRKGRIFMSEEKFDEFKVILLGVIFDPSTRKILIGKREENKSAPDLKWCFVGGRLPADEELDQVLKKRIKNRTGLSVHNLGAIFADNSSLQNKHLLLYFLCESVAGEEKAGVKFEELKWIEPKEISQYFNHPIHTRLKEYLDNLA